MSKKPGIRKTDDLSLLRREAEKLAASGNGKVENSSSDQDLAWLLHELQVQKIELEMQNDQLRNSNDELETQRSKLAGLYDLAPVGFFTLDLYGIIREINNTGSIMIGVPKKRLTGRSFRDFVSAEDVETFIDFLESIQIREIRQSCELAMLKQGGKFYARVEGIAPAYHTTENIRCYIAVIDITQQKNAKSIQEKQILQATITAQENERTRISQALHDSVGQLLYGIKLKIDQWDQQLKQDNQYTILNQIIDLAIQETRNISFELAPSILKDFGLAVTLNEMAERLTTKQLNIQVYSNLKKRLGLSLEVDLFRMIQELVNNSIKHADASNISIVLKNMGRITIEVTDDGNGFNYTKHDQIAGSGIAAIRNRLSLYNGDLNIESLSGKGSLVRLILEETKTI